MSQQLYLVGHIEIPYYMTRHGRGELYEHDRVKFYKIGIAEDPQERLNNMQSGNPHKLKLITTVDSDDASVVESSLHSLNTLGHKRGEWFKLTSNFVNSLKAVDYISAKNARLVNRHQYTPHFDIEQSFYIRLMRAREGSLPQPNPEPEYTQEE